MIRRNILNSISAHNKKQVLVLNIELILLIIMCKCYLSHKDTWNSYCICKVSGRSQLSELSLFIVKGVINLDTIHVHQIEN